MLKTIASTTESSPQMWGAPRRRMGARHRPGIIPADAGSTLAYRLRFGRREDHPRGCGEHPGSTGMRSEASGSSPRMRGAQAFGPDDRARRGIIPADAGSTSTVQSEAIPSEDHPRGCGEHLIRSRQVFSRLGSSPRMRGALPAISGAVSSIGSSPRMRGALRYRPQARYSGRIIPADVGSTHSCSAIHQCRKDHPRGCGEHTGVRGIRLTMYGSSPRMRGAPTAKATLWDWRRIIPADAGSTVALSEAVDEEEDHPRGCGEHSSLRLLVEQETGSSPRMRGARAGVHQLPSPMRIIPADAGSTATG